MKTLVLNLVRACCIILVLSFSAFSQELAGAPGSGEGEPTEIPQENPRPNKQLASVFDEIEKALHSGTIEDLNKHLSKKVYLNLRAGNNGYYSANQASYILQEFLEKHKLANLHFTDRGLSDDEAYSTGTALLALRGKYETVKIYIGLVKTASTYQISQLTIF